MFLAELSPEQRRAFLVLARQVIDADHRLTLQEVERLDRLYVEAGVAAEMAGAPSAAADLNLMFGTSRARMVVLLDLLLVGYADGTLEAREREAIEAIAGRLDVPEGAFEQALDWAERHHALVREALALGA